jgi:hypothetical protein
MNLETAKERLSNVKTVQEWNEKRNEIKGELSIEVLANLDGGGYIKTVLKKNK